MKELIVIGNAMGQGINTVNARDLHRFLGVKKDFSDWIKQQIERARLLEGRDFLKVPQKGELSLTGQIRTEYYLTLEAGKHIAMLSGTEKGFEVREYFIECERQVQSSTPQFTLPATFSEALRLLACEIEMKELVIAQRDQAIKTKAEIGSRREATAMATAAVAVRQANSLKDELGIGTNWKTAKAITWIKDYFALSQVMWSVLGKKLKALSDELGYEVRRVESEKFGAVNSYHVDVIEKLRARLEADDNMLGKYRAA